MILFTNCNALQNILILVLLKGIMKLLSFCTLMCASKIVVSLTHLSTRYSVTVYNYIFKAGILYFTDCQTNFNPIYSSNVTVAVFNDSKGVSRSNMTGALKVEMEKIFYSFKLKAKVAENDREYQIEVFKGTFEVCSLSKGVLSTLSDFLAGLMKDYSNVPLTCPIPPNNYHAYNLPIFDDKFIPSFFAGKGRSFEYTGLTKGKKSKSKPTVFLWQLKSAIKFVPNF